MTVGHRVETAGIDSFDGAHAMEDSIRGSWRSESIGPLISEAIEPKTYSYKQLRCCLVSDSALSEEGVICPGGPAWTCLLHHRGIKWPPQLSLLSCCIDFLSKSLHTSYLNQLAVKSSDEFNSRYI